MGRPPLPVAFALWRQASPLGLQPKDLVLALTVSISLNALQPPGSGHFRLNRSVQKLARFAPSLSFRRGGAEQKILPLSGAAEPTASKAFQRFPGSCAVHPQQSEGKSLPILLQNLMRGRVCDRFSPHQHLLQRNSICEPQL